MGKKGYGEAGNFSGKVDWVDRLLRSGRVGIRTLSRRVRVGVGGA
ncbi:MAG: hypothetical protein ACTSWP_05980 [Candidatus Freyarchaeota archaeon]|nr:hypothetical protein [Candidatus Freyrarchaeum guaymaensis]